MSTYTKSQQRELDAKPIAPQTVWRMGDQEIGDMFDTLAEDDEASTERLIQMTADACFVSYARVVEALSKSKS